MKRAGASRLCLLAGAGLAAAIFLFVSRLAAQAKPSSQPEAPFADDVKKYPGLLPELGKLTEDLRKNIRFPEDRHESALLPLLPAATTYYVAFPNYGDVARQAATILKQHLDSSPVLRDWWEHGSIHTSGPQIEDFLKKFDEASQFVGNELVVWGETSGKERNLVMVAPLRKPGLKNYLEAMFKGGGGTSAVQILELKDLAGASSNAGQQLSVLVRPDYVVAAQNVESLRSVNAMLDAKSGGLAGTLFGQRVEQAYKDGISMLLSADLHTILNQHSGSKQSQALLQQSGFGDMKYVVWQYSHNPDKPLSEGELSFVGPRRAIASWLISPGPMESLDFLSPQSPIVAGVRLKNFGDIFTDLKELASGSNPMALAGIAAMEQGMHISLKDDLLALLSGEVAVGMEGLPQVKPEWRTVLKVSDAEHLQATLAKICLAMHYKTSEAEEDGIVYHLVTIPSAQKPTELVYAFVKGYMLVSSKRETLSAGIRLEKSGASLGKSNVLENKLPAGYLPEVSSFLYEDPVAMTAANMRQFSPGMSESLAALLPKTEPIVYRAYGEEAAIKGVTTGTTADPSALLVVAAVAIPNILRARIAANESSAAATVRTIGVAEAGYRAAYKGYSRDLASLGPDPRGPGFRSAKHANMIDTTLGNSNCAAGEWCAKTGYRFAMAAECGTAAGPCREFAATASPASSATGSRNFCSTSDGVVRSRPGAPLKEPVTAEQCRKWAPAPN
ncbi:MAG TPA: hypothetical protein VND65_08170 [Candidatus Binatia bacterium]|nr:hypothetical protein [Candidatus Binatia bacterium]